MNSKSNSTILSDQPASQDALEFSHYREALKEIITDPTTDTPLTMGIFGSWGSGKTTLMRMLSANLGSKFEVIWFDAWKYSIDYSLWRAFLLRVLDHLRPKQSDFDRVKDRVSKEQLQKVLVEVERLEEGLYRDIEWKEKGSITINWPELTKSMTGGALQLSFALVPGLNFLSKAVEAAESAIGEGKIAQSTADVLKAFQRDSVEHFQVQLRFVEQFQRAFASLVERLIINNGRRLVVFIDDLDRCLPDKAIEILEAVKLFLDVPGCIFVLGLDQDVVSQGIKMRYQDWAANSDKNELLDGSKYLEKLIQLPFILPTIDPGAMETFIASLTDALPDPQCASVFASGLAQVPNPRQVKRAINVFLLLWKLAEKRKNVNGVEVSPVRLAKIVAIQSGHPDLYEQFRRDPACVRDLEMYFIEMSKEDRQSRPVIPVTLDTFTKRTDLKQLLMLFSDQTESCFSELNLKELSFYATLAGRTGTETLIETKEAKTLRRLGRYELIQEIGRGGFATVYKARDSQLGRTVALKVMHPEYTSPIALYRLQSVMRTWASFQHPNLVSVYDFGEFDGNFAIALEFIDGFSLRHVLNSRRNLDWRESIKIAKQIADALDYIHSRGIAHLDMSPSNILIDNKGQAFLTDPSIVIQGGDLSILRSHTITGTPMYMAPEQFGVQGSKMSAATDVYSLAIIFVEMVTGFRMFEGEYGSIVRAKTQSEIKLPSRWPQGIPSEQEITQVITKALALIPSERYQSAGQLIEALEALKINYET